MANMDNNKINLSNLFNLNKLGSFLGLNSNNRGGFNNPLSGLTRMFGGGKFNNQVNRNRCNVKVLPIEEAYRKIKTGTVFLLDVRTEMEFRTIRIKGSVNIPLDTLQMEIQNIVSNKDESILIYCATGSRVRRAIQILWSLGYTNLYIWEGAGMNTFAFQDLILYNENRSETN
ncbi:MAG: rhodanese-like domain-containing protein [Clostridia bacterium]|nr:rhodanese-like domain-containing protein [Clostridia bacterium]